MSLAFHLAIRVNGAEKQQLLSSLDIQTFSYVCMCSPAPISDVTSGTVHQMQWAEYRL